MHFEVLEYLKKYRHKFELEILKNELLKAGHSKEDIEEAANELLELDKNSITEDVPLFPSPEDTHKPAEKIEPVQKKENLDHPGKKDIRHYYTPRNLIILLTGIAVIVWIVIVYVFL